MTHIYCIFFYLSYTVKWLNAKVRSERRTIKVKKQSREQHARAMHLRALRFDRRGSCPGVRSRSRRKGRSCFIRHAKHVRKPKRKRSSLAGSSWIVSIINARIAIYSVPQLNQSTRLKKRFNMIYIRSNGAYYFRLQGFFLFSSFLY